MNVNVQLKKKKNKRNKRNGKEFNKNKKLIREREIYKIKDKNCRKSIYSIDKTKPGKGKEGK